jgi:gluconolactonase
MIRRLTISVFALACVLGACACQAVPMRAALLGASSGAYPEGPLFWNGALYVAEMGADTVFVHALGEKRAFFANPGCGPTSNAPYRGGLLVLCHLTGAVVHVDSGGQEVARWRHGEGRTRLRNPNDSAADAHGGVYFTDPGGFSRDIPAEGRIYYLDALGVMHKVAEGLWYPNGVWVDAASQSLYVSEHLAGVIWRYAMLPDGSLGARTLVLDVAPYVDRRRYREVGPDGLEIGPDRRLYVALYGAGRLIAFDPNAGVGAPVSVIPAPIPYVTNLAFAPTGEAVVVGAIENEVPPFPGRVVIMTLQGR